MSDKYAGELDNSPIDDDDNPEWTEADFARAVPVSEIHPGHALHALLTAFPKTRGVPRGPQKAPVKRPVTLRLDADVLEKFRATGPGWQTRMNEALRRAVV